MQFPRALVDHRATGIPQVAFDGILVREPVRSMYLHRIVGGLQRHVAGVPFGEGCLPGVAHAAVLELGGPVDEQPGRLQPRDRPRDHLLDQLMLADRLSERFALIGIGHAGIERRPRQPKRTGGDGKPALVDAAHRDLEPFAFFPDPVLDRYPDVVEGQLARIPRPDSELALDRAGREPFHPPFEDKGAQPLVLEGTVDTGEDEKVVGDVAKRDPHLRPVEHIGVTVPHNGRFNRSGVGSGGRFGQAERRDLFALCLWNQPTLPLLFRRPLPQRQAVEADMYAENDPKRGVDILEFVTGQGQADVVETKAPVILRYRQAENARLAHPVDQAAIDLALHIPFTDMRGNLALGELPHHIADLELLLGEIKIHVRNIAFRGASSRMSAWPSSRESIPPRLTAIGHESHTGTGTGPRVSSPDRTATVVPSRASISRLPSCPTPRTHPWRRREPSSTTTYWPRKASR